MADPKNDPSNKPKEVEPAFAPEQLATPAACPPLVGGFGSETPEVRAAREGRGEPEPKPLMTTTEPTRQDQGGASGAGGAPYPPPRQPAPATKPSTGTTKP